MNKLIQWSLIKLDTRFLPHNAHWDDPAEFSSRDPQLRQLARYPQARLLARTRQAGELQGVPVAPLPLALLRLETDAESDPQAWAETDAKPERETRA